MGADDPVDEEAPTSAAPTELGAAIEETEAHQAWALDDGDDEWERPTRLTPARITALAVAVSAIVIASAGTVIALKLRSSDSPPQATPATSTSPTPVATPPPEPPPPAEPSLVGADAEFIAELRSLDVPFSEKDPQYVIDVAQSICSLVREEPDKYPPGTYTMINFTDAMMTNNPDWSNRQATRFTQAAARHYCPDARGPSPDEIAAMAPDQRFLTILQDRYGMTPVSGGQSAIDAAPYICSWKSQGWTNDQILSAISSNNSREINQAIVDTAVQVNCPR